MAPQPAAPVTAPDEQVWPGDQAPYAIPRRKRIAIDRLTGKSIPEPPVPLPCPIRDARRQRDPHRALTGEEIVRNVCRHLTLFSERVLVVVVAAPLLVLAPGVLPVMFRSWLQEQRHKAARRRALDVRIEQWRRSVRIRARVRRRFASYRR